MKKIILRISSVIAAIASIASMLSSCSGDGKSEVEENFVYSGKGKFAFTPEKHDFHISFTTNCDWKIRLEDASASSWIVPLETEGSGEGVDKPFTVNFKIDGNKSGSDRSADLIIEYGNKGGMKKLNVLQDFLYPCTTDYLCDEMFFSSRCAGTLTSVQQSFDFNEDKSMIVFSQVTNYHKNTIGWGPRQVEPGKETETTPNTMWLFYFSHGNNIHYEKGADGGDYIWIANYGTVNDDCKYNNPQILSRVKLVNGASVKSFQTTENYYFGSADLHASFDEANDHLAIFSREKGDNERSNTLKIYKLSEVKATPVTKVTLKYKVEYGGTNSSDPFTSSYPEVMAHDCSKLKPVATFDYQFYNDYGRSWQTYCIYDNKVYFFLFKKSNSIIHSLIDILDFNGKIIKQGISQPFTDNIADMTKYHVTDDANRKYLENECILLKDNVMYLMYTGRADPDHYRHPYVFQFSVPE